MTVEKFLQIFNQKVEKDFGDFPELVQQIEEKMKSNYYFILTGTLDEFGLYFLPIKQTKISCNGEFSAGALDELVFKVRSIKDSTGRSLRFVNRITKIVIEDTRISFNVPQTITVEYLFLPRIKKDESFSFPEEVPIELLVEGCLFAVLCEIHKFDIGYKIGRQYRSALSELSFLLNDKAHWC